MTELNAKIPAGPLAQKWSNHKAHINVVSPANKRKLDVMHRGYRTCRWIGCCQSC